MQMNFSNFVDKASKTFDTAVQFASEKLGKAEEVTDFPSEYKELEIEVERIKTVYEKMFKSTRQLMAADSYEMPFSDQVLDVVERINEKLNLSANGGNDGINQMKNVFHGCAQAALECVPIVTKDEKFARNLNSYGMALDKIADARLELTNSVQSAFLSPFYNALDTNISFSVKSRKIAQRCRLDLDTCKARIKNAKPDKLPQLQQELKAAETNFNVSVEDAIITMRAVVENPESAKCVQDLIEAQKAFYAKALESFESINI